MTPEAIGLIKTSYEGVTATPRQLASRFYVELFSVAPNLRPLFPADLTRLQGHFESALALVVKNLDAVDALRESLRDLGAQHLHWGARPEDYLTAREALLRAIGALSASWNATLAGHWRSAITAIIVPMLEGAAVHTALEAERLAAEDAASPEH
jgi:hemoglobin-like flavoprotein